MKDRTRRALGMGGCSAFDVVLILERGPQRITGRVVQLEAERAGTDSKAFTPTTSSAAAASGPRQSGARRRSTEKYCPATIMLGATAAITHDFELVEAA